MKHLIGMSLLAGASLVHAQSASAPAPVSAAKKELVQRLLTTQQAALENMARSLTEQPARQMMGAATEAMQTRIAPEKRAAVTTQIQGHVRKYFDDALPPVRDKAVKIGQTSLRSMFEEKFTEDELRQLATALEAPAYKKFQQTLPEVNNAFLKKLVAEAEPILDPKLKVLQQNMGSALGFPESGANEPKAAAKPAPAKPAPAAQSASKPAKK